jgi:predicted NBD/HSP70 family sugar kinase
MQLVIKAYDEDDKAIDNIFNRVAHYLSIAVKNAMCLFDPKSVVLYGELFENVKFRKCLHLKLSQYSGSEKVNFSHFSLQLETLGPASTVIGHFMENGGVIEY